MSDIDKWQKNKTVQLLSFFPLFHKEGDRQTETGSANIDRRELKPKMGELIIKANLKLF